MTFGVIFITFFKPFYFFSVICVWFLSFCNRIQWKIVILFGRVCFIQIFFILILLFFFFLFEWWVYFLFSVRIAMKINYILSFFIFKILIFRIRIRVQILITIDPDKLGPLGFQNPNLIHNGLVLPLLQILSPEEPLMQGLTKHPIMLLGKGSKLMCLIDEPKQRDLDGDNFLNFE